MGQILGAPDTREGDLNGISDSKLKHGLTRTVAVIGGVKQQIKVLFFSFL